jgi:prevent-host-death family protein
MISVNIHHAKTHLSSLLARVASGEEIIIAKSGKPLAKLTRIQLTKKRVGGFAKGQIKVSDDFDEEDPEINKLFYS